MVTLKEAANDFLAQKRIAVAGVSRTPAGHGANVVYTGLRSAGYEVSPVNPNADEVEGDRCYPDLKSIPGGVEAVVVGTAPDVSAGVVRECREQGIEHVWLHRAFGTGSVSEEAAALGAESGIRLIAGACPMMFLPGADVGHRCMRWALNLMGRLPQEVSDSG
jgi:predicted CoA-binding protein